MSYILNALRKSEQERQAKQAQNIESSILAQAETAKHRSRWPVIITALVVVNLAVLTYLMTNNSVESPKQNKIVTALTPTPPKTKVIDDKTTLKPLAITKVEENQPKPSIAIKPTVATEKKDPIFALKTKPKTPRSKPAETPKKTLTAAINTQKEIKAHKPAPTKPSISQPIQTESKVETRVAKQPELVKNTLKKSIINNDLAAKVEAPEKVARPLQPSLVATAKKVASDYPWLKELPYEFRRQVPKLNINIFVYDENPKQGFVIVDMVKYQIDQDLPDHMTLKAIRRNSLVVSYKNRTFRIKRP